MSVRFIFDAKGIDDYVRQLRRIRRKMKWGKSLYLNEMAFQAKKEAERMIPRKMIVRNKAFMRRNLRVQKARSGAGDRMFSLMGSIRRPRFTGWQEQEFGGDKERKVVPTARVGNVQRGRMRAKARLKPGSKFRNPSEMTKARGAKQKAQAFMQRLSRERSKDPFILFGHPKFKPGLYQMKGRAPKQRIVTLQLFEEAKVRRKPWMRPTIDRLRTTWDGPAQWARVWRRMVGR